MKAKDLSDDMQKGTIELQNDSSYKYTFSSDIFKDVCWKKTLSVWTRILGVN